MSIYVNVVRVTSEAFDAIRRDLSQLQGVFFDQDEEILDRLRIAEGDSAGIDYRITDEMIELDDAVHALFQAAAGRGDYIIGVVS